MLTNQHTEMQGQNEPSWLLLNNLYCGDHRRQVWSMQETTEIILGDGGYHGMGYITLTKMAHELLTFDFHLNDLIGYHSIFSFW